MKIRQVKEKVMTQCIMLHYTSLYLLYLIFITLSKRVLCATKGTRASFCAFKASLCCWDMVVHCASSFLTRELRACARASYRYHVGNGIRSLARLVDSCKLFLDFRLLSTFDSFWRAINRRNGDLC